MLLAFLLPEAVINQSLIYQFLYCLQNPMQLFTFNITVFISSFQINQNCSISCNIHVNWLNQTIRSLSSLIITDSSMAQFTMINQTMATTTMINYHTAAMMSHTVSIAVITAICSIAFCGITAITLCCILLYRRKRKK